MGMVNTAAPVLLAVAWSLASCSDAGSNTAAVPESEQVVRTELKTLYMAASAAPPQSAAQQQIILKMAQQASNGKEALLTVQASAGVFPPNGGPQDKARENDVHGIVTDKLMRFGTLEQLIECARHDAVAQSNARQFVQRMFELAGGTQDQAVWYRIRAAAFHLKLGDMVSVAQAKLDQLSAK